MDQKALTKAQSRLRIAHKSLGELRQAKNFQEFSDVWSVFLHAAKGIYTTLEQGAKATPQARQWFGGKNQERKDDPLLRYVTEARNDDEHGIEEVMEYLPNRVDIGGGAEQGFSHSFMDSNGNTFTNCGLSPGSSAVRYENVPPEYLPAMRSLDGRPIRYEETEAKISLKPVRDRAKNAYAPPTMHLGRAIQPEPLGVADLTLRYLEGLVHEAEGFGKP